MKWRIDSRYWFVLGAMFLWGCPIDDARFKEPDGSSSSSSSSGSEASSSSSSSSSSSGSAGAGGNGGAAGMGGAMASSSGGGMGGAGGGQVCPAAPGTAGSCGTTNCPPCPTLVMLGTGTNGVTGTFVSSDSPPWKTAPYMNESSTHAPTLVAMPGEDKAMALIRRADTVIRYVTWTPAGFSGWSSIDGTVVTSAAVSAHATDTAIHVSFYGTNSRHFYALTTDATTFAIKAEDVNSTPSNPNNQAFGPYPASVAALPTGPIVAYAGDDKDLYTHERNAMEEWPAVDHNAGISVAEVPAIVTYGGNPLRDVLIVVMRGVPMGNQLYWTARESGTWTTPAEITSAKSTEPVLLALPNGDAILTYRDDNKKVWWTRFTGIDAKWSAPQQPPGDMAAKLKPALALGAGDAEVELLFVDDATGTGYHSRLHQGAANFTMPVAIPGATGLVGIAAATNL